MYLLGECIEAQRNVDQFLPLLFIVKYLKDPEHKPLDEADVKVGLVVHRVLKLQTGSPGLVQNRTSP